MAKSKRVTQDISRTQAAAFIERMLELELQHNVVEGRETDEQLRGQVLGAIRGLGLACASRCHGEAHSNPNIDHCSVCMPRWGVIMTPVRVK